MAAWRVTGLALLASFVAAPAFGRDLSPSEENAIESAASSVASANFCNFHIDIPALGRFIEGKAGHLAIEAEGAARIMLIVLASEAIQEDLLGIRSMSRAEAVQFCRKQIDAYGPTGRIAPGILSITAPPG